MPKKEKTSELRKKTAKLERRPFLQRWFLNKGLDKNPLSVFLVSLNERLSLFRLFAVLSFSFLLSFLLFFQFDLTTSVRDGERTTRDVKSPFSFEIEDTQASAKKRIEAQKSILPVFDFNPNVLEKTLDEIYQSFFKMRSIAKKTDWSRNASKLDLQIKEFFGNKPDFDNSLSYKISDRNFEWLIQEGFSLRVDQSLRKIISVWGQSWTADGFLKSIPNDQEKIIGKRIDSEGEGEEIVIPVKVVKDLSKEALFTLEGVTFSYDLTPAEQNKIKQLAFELMKPNLTLNQNLTQKRKEEAKAQVLPVVMSVKKGQLLLAEGAVAQPVHVSLVEKIKEIQNSSKKDFLVLFSTLFFTFLILVGVAYIKRYEGSRLDRKSFFKDFKIISCVLITVLLSVKLLLFALESSVVLKLGYKIPDLALWLFTPFLSGAMLMSLLLKNRNWNWFFSFVFSVGLAFIFDKSLSLFLVSFLGNLAAGQGLMSCRSRNDIYKSGLYAGLISGVAVILMMGFDHSLSVSFFEKIIWLFPAAILGGILSSFLTLILTPVFESLFDCLTDVKLLELANFNHPIIKDLIVKAPGTYHHSMVVGSMVEAAAESIGANGLLGKVMAHFHDIGKMEHPAYFIENQRPGFNPHDSISPHLSKTILVAHVKDGLEMGLKHKLGKPILDGIQQHHGTTLIKYFYTKAKQESNEEDRIEEADFRYSGPKPRFKESALLMLADSLEAAARSLDEPSPMRLQNLMNKIVESKVVDGQLDESDLTFEELNKAKESFYNILLGIYHHRIDYPDDKLKDTTSAYRANLSLEKELHTKLAKIPVPKKSTH